MNVVTGVELIGPAFRREADVIHKGFWTPQLAEWREGVGFNEIRDLQYYTWSGSTKVTGAEVNACPILCIVKSDIGHNNLVVSVTGTLGSLNTALSAVSGEYVESGFSTNNQYNKNVYRREFVTGGGTWQHQFTIPQYTQPGKVYTLPTKRVYKITNIAVSGDIADQPTCRLGFYALADNGSKILHGMNWDKIFEYARKCLYGTFPNPRVCVRCDGTGYIGTEDNTCRQCDGYGYNGPNASGLLLTKLGFDNNLIQNSTETDQTFRNKLWTKTWWVTPTKKEIQRYFAHFARIQDNEVEVDNIDRTSSSSLPTGIESKVDVKLPYNIPLSVFEVTDGIWEQMAKSVEPAGIRIDFSFLARAFTGYWTFEEWDSWYMSGHISGTLTGYKVDPMEFGFYNPIARWDFNGSQGWYCEWGEDFHFFNHLDIGTHASGYVSGCSGIMLVSGSTYAWWSGSMTGAADEWLKWAWPSGGNANGDEWHTGLEAEEGYNQDLFFTSGTYHYDNFWASGAGYGIIY